MRRSVPALALGFAGYGGLIAVILASLVAGLVVLAATGGLAAGELALALTVTSVVGLAIGGPFLVTAWGLHRRRAWARWPALGLAVLIIGSAPLGTLLGGYALYTLLDAEGVAQLDA